MTLPSNIPSNIAVEINPASANHAALRAIKTYWDEKRGARRMPARADINPSELKTSLRQVLLVDVLPGADDFRYRLLGSRLRPYFPVEATGQTMRAALAPFGTTTVEGSLEVYRTVVAQRAPLRVAGPGDNFAQPSKFFEAMLLPLGETDDAVNMIFGAFEFDWRPPA
jgi:hypothetical protein